VLFLLSIGKSIALRKHADSLFVMNIKNGDVFQANAVCEMILELCDGKHSERNIVDEICKRFPSQKKEVIKGDVSGCIASLKKHGIVG